MTEANKFDDLLIHLGTGPWNLLIFFLAFYCMLLVPPQFISGVFLAPDINYTCLPPTEDESIIVSKDSCSYTRVTEAGEEVEEACTAWDFDTSVFSSTLTSEFSLVCGKKYLQALYQSAYVMGTFFSPVLGGYLADRYGRKVVIVAAQVFLAVFSITIVFLSNMVAIMTVRFLLGMFNLLTFTILTLETCEPKRRVLLGMLLGLPWSLGTMAFSGTAFLIREWRWLQLAVSLPFLVILPVLYFIDESPRWLIVRGRHNQAMRVLRKAARWNRVTLQPEAELRALMNEIQEESAVCSSAPASTDRKTKKFRLTLPTLLSTPAIRVITLVMCIDYFAASFVFDGLNLSGSSYEFDLFLYMTLSGMVEMPGYLLATPIVNRWGRKIPTVLIFLLCGIAVTVITFIPPEVQALKVVLALLGKWCISGVYQILYLYASELFPTEVRMQGIGVGSVSSQLASTTVPFITKLLGPVFPWLPSLIFGLAAATAGVFTVLLRETKGVALPDTIADLSAATPTKEAIRIKEGSLSTITGSLSTNTSYSIYSSTTEPRNEHKNTRT